MGHALIPELKWPGLGHALIPNLVAESREQEGSTRSVLGHLPTPWFGSEVNLCEPYGAKVRVRHIFPTEHQDAEARKTDVA